MKDQCPCKNDLNSKSPAGTGTKIPAKTIAKMRMAKAAKEGIVPGSK